MKVIEAAVNQSLAGQDWDHQLIVLDDSKVDKDLYIQLVFKFYAAMRHDLFTKIQNFWKANQEELMDEFNKKRAQKVPGT